MAVRNPRSEAGFALIEVIVAAAVLAVVALAVLSGIDGATAASAREKARSVASNLAEQDQERMRAMPIEVLRDPPQSGENNDGVIKVDGVTYTVKSEAKWITDDVGGEPVCGANSNQVEYLHIITTVSSAIAGQRFPPVTVDSLVAPTTEYAEGHGAVGLKVNDRTNQKGVSGINVTAVSSTGFTAPQQTTNAAGCVLFKSLPVGSYTLKVDQGGYLDRLLNQKSQVTQTVVAKTVSFATLQYDRALTAGVTVKTHVPGKTFTAAGARDSKSPSVSTTNGAYVGMLRTVSSASPVASFSLTGLYPYSENSYMFFTGGCRFASPDTYDADYFATINTAGALPLNPATPQPQQATVQQPPFYLRVMRRSATGSFTDDKIKVFAKLYRPAGSTDTCNEPASDLGITQPWPAKQANGTCNATWDCPTPVITGTNGNHWISRPGAFDPGMPFGRYKICVVDTSVSGGRWALWPNGASTTSATNDFYDNSSADGGAQKDVDISTWPTGNTGTSCTFPAAPTS